MNIILGKENAEQLMEKNIVLELDTFRISGKEIVSYCVLGLEDVPLNELSNLEHNIKLHEAFVSGVKRRDRKFCKDLGSEIMKTFNGILAEYYSNAIERLNKNTVEWDYAIIK